MERKKYVATIFVFFMAGMLSAQIDKKDSVWVADIISQGGEYEISDQVLKQIREGGLPNLEIFEDKSMPSSPELVEEETVAKDNQFLGLHALHLSPTDILLYRHKSDSVFIVKSATLSAPNNVWVKEYFQIPRSWLQPKVPYAIEQGVYNGSFMNFIVAKPILTFSAEEGLERIFSPEERHKTRDRKAEKILKNYESENNEQ